MNSFKTLSSDASMSPLHLAKQQRSHILFVLSNPMPDRGSEFLSWYKQDYHHAIEKSDNILSVQHYEQDEPEEGYPPPEYQYFGIYELSLDGAEEAESIIQQVTDMHSREDSANTPATWLYYPISEAVGRPAIIENPMLIVAFANGIRGSESEFREWYCTRHIRHALNAPYNANGQCFGLTNFQRSGSAEPIYEIMAVYEQENTPQEALEFWNSLPTDESSELEKKFLFPTMDLTRVGECYYRPITEKLYS